MKGSSSSVVKICILTAIWKRPKVTKVFLDQVDQLRKYAPEKFQIELVVVGSDAADLELMKGRDINYCRFANEPLGMKWNAGLKAAHLLDFDWLLILGSDDLASGSLLDAFYKHRQDSKYIGFRDMYLYNSQTKKMKYWEGYKGKRSEEPIGAGRFIHRSLLDEIKWRLWDNYRNKGLDRSMTNQFKKKGVVCKSLSLKESKAFLVDIKSAVNMGKFDDFFGAHSNYKRLFSVHFESNIIKKIYEL